MGHRTEWADGKIKKRFSIIVNGVDDDLSFKEDKPGLSIEFIFDIYFSGKCFKTSLETTDNSVLNLRERKSTVTID